MTTTEARLPAAEFARLFAQGGMPAVEAEVARRFPQTNKLQALHDAVNSGYSPTPHLKGGQVDEFDPWHVLPANPTDERLERDLQDEIKQELRRMGYKFLEFKNNAKRGGQVYTVKGWPDALVGGEGWGFFFETKMVGKQPEPEQCAMHALLRSLGCEVWWGHDIEGVLKIIGGRKP